MGFVLYILSLLLSAVLFGIGITYSLIVGFFQVRWRTGISKADDKFMKLAGAVDKFGGVVCEELFNAILIKKNATIKFGNIVYTISQVVGFSLVAGTLRPAGKVLNWILDTIDEGHCYKAIGAPFTKRAK